MLTFNTLWKPTPEIFGNRSGDHIDLWNGRRLTDWLSYPRIQLGFSIEGTFSDYHESREPMHPDDFISDLWDLDQAAVLGAAQKQRRALKRPPMEAGNYLEMLMRQGLVQTSKVLGPYEMML